MTTSAPDAPGCNGWNHTYQAVKPSARRTKTQAGHDRVRASGRAAARLELVLLERVVVVFGVVVHPGRVAAGWRGRQPGASGVGWPASQVADGARRASRSRDAAQAASSGGAVIDRAPRTPSRSPARTNRPSPTTKARWSGRGPGVWMTRRGTSPASSGDQIVDLADGVRQRPATTGPGQDRDAKAFGDGLGARRMVRVDVGQGDGLDRTAALRGEGQRPVEPGPGRVARIDEHEPAAPDEIGAHRLAGDAAPGRHDDPGDRVVDGLGPDRAEPTGRQALADLVEGRHVLELLEGRARRQPEREPARAIAASASVGRSQAWAATSPPSKVGVAPSGRAAAKNRASNRRG